MSFSISAILHDVVN